MAAALSTATLAPATAMGSGVGASMRKRTSVVHLKGLGSFGGLKQQNSIASLGLPACTNQQFTKVASSLRAQGKGRGGALSSTCNAAEEIFKIAAIMNGLVLVGVAVGFVLLRIEAFVEEAD